MVVKWLWVIALLSITRLKIRKLHGKKVFVFAFDYKSAELNLAKTCSLSLQCKKSIRILFLRDAHINQFDWLLFHPLCTNVFCSFITIWSWFLVIFFVVMRGCKTAEKLLCKTTFVDCRGIRYITHTFYYMVESENNDIIVANTPLYFVVNWKFIFSEKKFIFFWKLLFSRNMKITSTGIQTACCYVVFSFCFQCHIISLL